MRISPTRVTFNYPQNVTPARIYSPKIIQERIIIGEPIVFTNVSPFAQNPQTLSPISSRKRATTYVPK